MISFAMLLILLLGAAGVATGVITFSRSRPGLAAMIGVIAVLLAVGLLFLGLFAVRSHTAMQPATVVWPEVPVNVNPPVVQEIHGIPLPQPQQLNNFTGQTTQVTASVSVVKLFLFLGIIVFLVALVIRRLISPQACGPRKIWPLAFAAPLIFAFFFIGTVRYESSHRHGAASEAFQQHAREIADRQNAIMARQQANIEARTKKLHAQANKLVGRSDIHAEMDKFDASRIPLPPESNQMSAPAAPPAVSASPENLVAVATHSAVTNLTSEIAESGVTVSMSQEKPESKPKADEAARKTADVNRKRNKLETRSQKSTAKTRGTTAQASLAASSSDAKEQSTEYVQAAKVAQPSPATTAGARPAWINDPRGRKENMYREVIETDPYESVDECYQAADVYLLLKVYQRMQELAGLPYIETRLPSLTFRNGAILGDGNTPLFFVSHGGKNPTWVDPRLRALSEMGITIDFLRRELIANQNSEPHEFIETVEHSFGPMKKLYRQIEFSTADDSQLMQSWGAYQRRERFAVVGLGAGALLSLVGMAFALLKIDTWTKGYYTKRLFVGVPVAIIGGVLLLSIWFAYMF